MTCADSNKSMVQEGMAGPAEARPLRTATARPAEGPPTKKRPIPIAVTPYRPRPVALPAGTPALDDSAETWWTSRRVRIFLDLYQQIAEVLDGYGRDCGRFFTGAMCAASGEAAWAELLHARADLDQAMAALPPRQRQVARMHWVEGYDQCEIAAECRISQQRASAALSAGLRRIEKFLGVGVV